MYTNPNSQFLIIYILIFIIILLHWQRLLFCFSELKRRLKAEQKAKEKLEKEKNEAAKKVANPKPSAAAEEEISPNVSFNHSLINNCIYSSILEVSQFWDLGVRSALSSLKCDNFWNLVLLKEETPDQP